MAGFDEVNVHVLCELAEFLQSLAVETLGLEFHQPAACEKLKILGVALQAGGKRGPW